MSDDEFWRIVIGGAFAGAVPYFWNRIANSPAQQAKKAAREHRRAQRAHALGYRLGQRWAARK